jgi:hypothetical protein
MTKADDSAPHSPATTTTNLRGIWQVPSTLFPIITECNSSHKDTYLPSQIAILNQRKSVPLGYAPLRWCQCFLVPRSPTSYTASCSPFQRPQFSPTPASDDVCQHSAVNLLVLQGKQLLLDHGCWASCLSFPAGSVLPAPMRDSLSALSSHSACLQDEPLLFYHGCLSPCFKKLLRTLL